jgi:hypothetical protein
MNSKGVEIMSLTATELQNMSLEELEKLYEDMKKPTEEEKMHAWKRMDTGIYDEKGSLIGDIYEEIDRY